MRLAVLGYLCIYRKRKQGRGSDDGGGAPYYVTPATPVGARTAEPFDAAGHGGMDHSGAQGPPTVATAGSSGYSANGSGAQAYGGCLACVSCHHAPLVAIMGSARDGRLQRLLGQRQRRRRDHGAHSAAPSWCLRRQLHPLPRGCTSLQLARGAGQHTPIHTPKPREP